MTHELPANSETERLMSELLFLIRRVQPTAKLYELTGVDYRTTSTWPKKTANLQTALRILNGLGYTLEIVPLEQPNAQE